MSLRTDRILELQTQIEQAVTLLRIPETKKEITLLEEQMQAPDFWQDSNKATAAGKRYEEVRQSVTSWDALQKEVQSLAELSAALDDEPDEAMSTDIEEQFQATKERFRKKEFEVLLNGKHDKQAAIVSFFAGSGGTEAQDWAEMIRRMIMRYAEHQGWRVTLLDESRGEVAGIKSSTIRIEGHFAYGLLKSEHGTHRLVRISPFDAEGMRHTSFAGVDVLPELDAEATVQIDPKDLRIDTFMAGGKGGQSVNTTYSAVRIVHIPTGITVQCQNERSQLQNRETAMRILQAKLERLQEEQEAKDRQAMRGEYKSAEWGNQIRSYVLQPYKMVKDVRTRFESTEPERVLEGDLTPFIEAYLRFEKEQVEKRKDMQKTS